MKMYILGNIIYIEILTTQLNSTTASQKCNAVTSLDITLFPRIISARSTIIDIATNVLIKLEFAGPFAQVRAHSLID